MDKQKIENKAIYFMCLLSMICILVLIAYFFFLRNVEIDIMANAQYTYVGENGNASVTVSAKQGDLNQRTQDFLNSVQYEVSPNTDLSNGDTIHVTATYDEALANQYHYQPKSVETDVVVKGLAHIPSSVLVALGAVFYLSSVILFAIFPTHTLVTPSRIAVARVVKKSIASSNPIFMQ